MGEVPGNWHLYPTSTRASSRGGVWRQCGAKPRPDEQKSDIRHLWPDERATNREVHIHQGPGL